VKYVRAFLRFWWDFIVGDDWRVAVVVAIALAATWGVARTSVPAWWLVPVAVALVVPFSLWRVVRSSPR